MEDEKGPKMNAIKSGSPTEGQDKMTMRRGRKFVVGGAAVVGAVMLLASSAYACTTFKGKMTVTGGGGSSFATGNNSSMGYCLAPDDNAAAPAGGAHGADGSAITVTIQPAVSPCGTASPSTRTNYDINFFNGKAYTYTISSSTGKRVYSNWIEDCMTPFLRLFGSSPGSVQNLAKGQSYTNGNTTSYNVNLPAVTNANASGQASAVCFSDSAANEGNQVPIIITA